MTQFMTFIQVMIFYILLAYVISPAVGYYAFGNSIEYAGHGFVAGSILSVILWYTFGKKMVESAKDSEMVVY